MKILVLGAGLVGRPITLDLANEKNFDVSVCDKSKVNLDAVYHVNKIKKIECDVLKNDVIENLIADYHLIVNALPGFSGYQITKTIIENGKDVIDISFFPEDPTPLEQIALEKNVTAIIDCGVAPGMSYILAGYASHIMQKTTKLRIYVGGLPKIRLSPFEYKAVFSPVDVIEEYTRPARFVADGNIVVKPALSDLEKINFPEIGTLEAFNTDGLRSLIKNIECPDMIEKTLRYPGHIEKIQFLKDCGFFNTEKIQTSIGFISPLELTSKLLFPIWKLAENEEDITIMKIIVEGLKDGQQIKYTYSLFDSYDQVTKIHSMARTTGYTATAAVRMVLSGIFREKGLIYPEFIGRHPDCVNFMLNELKERNVIYSEKIETITE